jgi:hypothetical protein
MRYYDILFVRVFYQYKKWNEKASPGLYSLLVLSFFQNMNLLSAYFFVRSLFEKDQWSIPKLYIASMMGLICVFDYVRIYHVIGFDHLLARYDGPDKRRLPVHPLVYFSASIVILFLLSWFGMYPHIK